MSTHARRAVERNPARVAAAFEDCDRKIIEHLRLLGFDAGVQHMLIDVLHTRVAKHIEVKDGAPGGFAFNAALCRGVAIAQAWTFLAMPQAIGEGGIIFEPTRCATRHPIEHMTQGKAIEHASARSGVSPAILTSLMVDGRTGAAMGSVAMDCAMATLGGNVNDAKARHDAVTDPRYRAGAAGLLLGWFELQDMGSRLGYALAKDDVDNGRVKHDGEATTQDDAGGTGGPSHDPGDAGT